MHIDEETTQRFMHGELDDGLDQMVRRHMAGCAECRNRFETEARDEEQVHALLRTIDHPRPPLTARELLVGPEAAPRRRPPRRWRRAAVAILFLGVAGTAWAVPGSPVPGWTDSAIDRLREFAISLRDTIERESATTDAGDAAPDPSGLGVDPGANLIVLFENTWPDATVAVMLYDGDDVRASALDGSAVFTSDGDRLRIGNPESTARYDIRIPRDAPRVEVRVGSRRIFLKDGGTVTAAVTQGVGGSWVIPLAGGR